MKISILIPVLNERNALRRTLRALVPEKQGHEIIVVDQGSEDGSPDVAAAHPWVRLVRASGNRSECLNAAAATASGELLVFLQAGALPARGWSRVLDTFFSKSTDAGHMQVTDADPDAAGTSPLRRLAERIGHRIMGGPAELTGTAVKKSVFDRVGGFRPVPEFEWLAFAKRVQEEGGKVASIPHPVLLAAKSGNRQVDPLLEMSDELCGAWHFFRTGSLDPIRCRRGNTAAILLGHDLFDASVSDYLASARAEAQELVTELLLGYPGARSLHFLGGPASTAWARQVNGLNVHEGVGASPTQRLHDLLGDLKQKGMEAVAFVRAEMLGLDLAQLRWLTERPETPACAIIPNEAGDEWLALWFADPASPLLQGWDFSYGLAALDFRMKDQGVEPDLACAIPALLTDRDAREGYYAGLLQGARPA